MQNKLFIGYFLLASFMLVSLVGCNLHQKPKAKNAFATQDTIMPPVVIEAGKPAIQYLSDCPPPLRIDLSTKPAPVHIPADFYVTMQHFNTDQGLALSSVLCGFKDKSGNLWFGTSGNGVSKYDGKTFTNYYSSHGLIHNLINCISDDSKGNIWFGTYGGISIYDGISFLNFTTKQGLANNNVNKILEDRNGNIWIATDDGLSRFNPNGKDTEGNQFFNYTTEQGLAGNIVIDILEDSKSNVWFATDYGICRLNAGAETKGEKPISDYSRFFGLEGKQVFGLTEDKEGNLWLVVNEGVLRYDPAREGTGESVFTMFTTADGLLTNKIRCSLVDREGNLWLGTKKGVSEFSKRDSSFMNFTTQQGLANNEVTCITEDNAGSLWFGTLGGGLSRYDGESVMGFTPQQGLPVKTVFAIAGDAHGNLWMGGNEGGITKFEFKNHETTGKSFLNFSSAQGLTDHDVMTMIIDKAGNLWFGTENGLSKYDGKSIVTYTSQQGLINNGVVSLFEDSKGNIWIGTYEAGLSMFDGKSFKNYTTATGLVHNTVWDIHEDKSGHIWFATRGGLSRFDGESFVNFTKLQGLPDNKLSVAMEDHKGNLFIGSWGGGVSIIRKNRVEELTQSNAAQITESFFENFSTSNGLANDVVYGILEDEDGNIIIGTNVGLTILRGGLDPTRNHIANETIEYYHQKTGYSIRDISNNFSMLLDSRGFLWAGTGDKLIRFDYKRVHKNAEAPNVFIESVNIENEKISWHSLRHAKMEEGDIPYRLSSVAPYITDELITFGRNLGEEERNSMIDRFSDIRFDSIRPFYAIPENLVLPFAHNYIGFDFLAVETTRPFLIQYQYMLEGNDEKWSPVTDKTMIGYSNIREGHYTFKLKARSPYGTWSEPVTYAFEILPPWYRSWIAYLFYGLLLIGGVFIVDRYQRRRLIARERQSAMVRELEQAKEIQQSYTDLKAAQAQLIHAEKMASLGELTAGIAHEIQNPLNFVNNFSEVSVDVLGELNGEIEKGNLEEIKIITADLKQNLEKINQHGKRASSIVKGMLDHSRSSSNKKEPTDINALADECLRLAYHGFKAKHKSFNAVFTMEPDETLPEIKVISQEIGRVFLNLMNNAFYAVSERENQQESGFKPTVSVSTKKLDDKVEVRVKDNGNGIPDEVIDRIFQPFFTTKPTGQGTGLGLSMSYDIISNGHGGDVTVKTEPGKGTEFIISIPIK